MNGIKTSIPKKISYDFEQRPFNDIRNVGTEGIE